jgi:hypothetical protein
MLRRRFVWILLTALFISQVVTGCMVSDMFTHARCYGTRVDNHIIGERR